MLAETAEKGVQEAHDIGDIFLRYSCPPLTTQYARARYAQGDVGLEPP